MRAEYAGGMLSRRTFDGRNTLVTVLHARRFGAAHVLLLACLCAPWGCTDDPPAGPHDADIADKDTGNDHDVSVDSTPDGGYDDARAESDRAADSGPSHDRAIDAEQPDVDGSVSEDAADADSSDVADAAHDAPDGSSQDGPRPDGWSNGPPFMECTEVKGTELAPRAIFEAISATAAPTNNDCHCTGSAKLNIGRVICGSLDGDPVFGIEACNPLRPPLPAIAIVYGGCPKNGSLYTTLHPLSEWDALAAEQIVGHGGTVDGGRDAADAEDAMVEDGVADVSGDPDARD